MNTKPKIIKQPMKKSVKRKWLKALRSGEYDQAKDQLCKRHGYHSLGETTYSFCCLGVLQNLYHEETGTEFKENDWGDGNHTPDVQKWSGLPADLVTDTSNVIGAADHLARMNDAGRSFKQIANWIEKNL